MGVLLAIKPRLDHLQSEEAGEETLSALSKSHEEMKSNAPSARGERRGQEGSGSVKRLLHLLEYLSPAASIPGVGLLPTPNTIDDIGRGATRPSLHHEGAG